MSYQDDRMNVAVERSLVGPALPSFPPSAVAHPLGLAGETAAVTFCAVGAIAFLNVYEAPGVRWLAIPGILVAAALVPTWAGKREFPCFGRDRHHIQRALGLVGCVCVCTFPPVFLGLWLLMLLHVPLPLRPAAGGQQNWLAWLVYQFLYVAVAEEVFFRGYIQANVARLLRQAAGLAGAVPQHLAVLTSAACFALAHVVVQGRITSLLVFLPGLVLAWLFARTQSLLAPILFHGLANTAYGVMAAVLI